MIYNDDYAFEDTAECPGSRPDEICVNCGEYWNQHIHWGCEEALYFHETHETNRYLTQSMINSISPAEANLCSNTINSISISVNVDAINPKDMSDWRNWAHNVSGECPCGIVKSICDYHR